MMMMIADSDSDSDVVLHQQIPINSNHRLMLSFESQLDSNNNHVRHPPRNKHTYHRRGGAAKYHNHSCAKTNSSDHDDTNDYFELARQARLLRKGDAMPAPSINDHGKHVVPDTENEVRDRGKGVINTGESFRLKGARFQLNKPFINQKNMQPVGNHTGEGSSTFNGFSGQRKLVRNGCISPDNVSQFREMSRHNAGPSGQFSGQVVDVHGKGKGKLGLSDCSEAQKTEGGVIIHEPRETSACNEKCHGLNLRRRTYRTGKRKYRKDKPNLGESTSLIFGSPTNCSHKITIANSSDEEERERDAFSEEYWSLEEPSLNNEALPDQSAIISQVESDEILARRLQEQFNQEAQNFQAFDEEDDDAIIARALQEEDDDFVVDGHNVMPFRRSRREVNDRGRSMEHLHSQSHHFQFEGLPMHIPNRRRTQTRFNNPDMDYEMLLISQLRRGLGSSNMDIDTRLSILEALEEVFENRSDVDISGHVYRNDPNPLQISGVVLVLTLVAVLTIGRVQWRTVVAFDELYEVLSTLDEDNHRHSGVTDGQINILPTSTIKGDRMEDACVICLEDPAAGDVMRHLPCLHKFHKECIDTWLRRKNACPVCKSSIT